MRVWCPVEKGFDLVIALFVAKDLSHDLILVAVANINPATSSEHLRHLAGDKGLLRMLDW